MPLLLIITLVMTSNPTGHSPTTPPRLFIPALETGEIVHVQHLGDGKLKITATQFGEDITNLKYILSAGPKDLEIVVADKYLTSTPTKRHEEQEKEFQVVSCRNNRRNIPGRVRGAKDEGSQEGRRIVNTASSENGWAILDKHSRVCIEKSEAVDTRAEREAREA